MTRRVAHFFCDSMPQGWIGRSLPRLFAAAGLVNVQVTAETRILLSDAWRRDSPFGFGSLPERAEQAGIIIAAERQAWEAAIDQRIEQGTFFAAFMGFRVIGHRA